MSIYWQQRQARERILYGPIRLVRVGALAMVQVQDKDEQWVSVITASLNKLSSKVVEPVEIEEKLQEASAGSRAKGADE